MGKNELGKLKLNKKIPKMSIHCLKAIKTIIYIRCIKPLELWFLVLTYYSFNIYFF